MAERSKARAARPKKPYPDFPLFPHRNGCWAKKIRGRFVFFGPWSDAHGALERYLAQRDELHAGTAPPPVRLPTTRRATTIRGTRPSSPGRGGRAEPNGAERLNATGATVGPPAANDAAPELRLTGTPRSVLIPAGGAVTIRDVVNAFLTAKQRRLDAGEMTARSFSEQHVSAGNLLKFLGKHRLATDIAPDDFSRLRAKLAETRGPVALGNEIGRVRSIFKFAYEADLIPKPVRFGPDFSKPSKKSVRLARRASGSKMFEPDEIHLLLDTAGPQMRAMILLGLNCGLGNTDVGELSKSHLHIKTGVIDFPRSKTGIARRCILWPETIAALKEVRKVRPPALAAEDKDLIFITKGRHRWVRVTEPGARSKGKHTAVVKDAVAPEFTKAAKAADVYRELRGFYALRHTFRTVADEIGDRRAIDLIMGHEDGSDIANAYVERIDDARLRKVTDHVREWLFGFAADQAGDE